MGNNSTKGTKMRPLINYWYYKLIIDNIYGKRLQIHFIPDFCSDYKQLIHYLN